MGHLLSQKVGSDSIVHPILNVFTRYHLLGYIST